MLRWAKTLIETIVYALSSASDLLRLPKKGNQSEGSIGSAVWFLMISGGVGGTKRRISEVMAHVKNELKTKLKYSLALIRILP
jgi:hypothetical protein